MRNEPPPTAIGHRDPRIDAYIAKSAGFAQPILRRLREVVHAACPEVQESLKWGAPSFGYRGKILCGMAAFKQHASFGFWQGARVVGGEGAKPFDGTPEEGTAAKGTPAKGMGQFGRLGQLSDLPAPRALAAYLTRAMELIDEGVTRPSASDAILRPPPAVPEDLAAAVEGNAGARANFDRFPPSQRREYIEWITGAKRGETRQRRLAQAIGWLAEGKPRNWKYRGC